MAYTEILYRCSIRKKERTCKHKRATRNCYNDCPKGSDFVSDKVAMELFDNCRDCGKALTCEMEMNVDIFEVEGSQYVCKKCLKMKSTRG